MIRCFCVQEFHRISKDEKLSFPEGFRKNDWCVFRPQRSRCVLLRVLIADRNSSGRFRAQGLDVRRSGRQCVLRSPTLRPVPCESHPPLAQRRVPRGGGGSLRMCQHAASNCGHTPTLTAAHGFYCSLTLRVAAGDYGVLHDMQHKEPVASPEPVWKVRMGNLNQRACLLIHFIVEWVSADNLN